ncbi:MAG: ABC transporter permease, partial [Merdibacter sp.]
MKKDKRIFGKVIMVLAVLFFYVPILFMIIFSFNSGRSLTNFDGFSLMWYERMFENRDMMESLQTTIVIALIATLVSTLLGTISAIGLSRCRK